MCFFFIIMPLPPSSNRTYPLFPYPTLCRSKPSFCAFVPAFRRISTRLNTAENPTAIYVDGVLIPDQREGFRDLFDIEQITVLKGPQGTLFGRNEIGRAHV